MSPDPHSPLPEPCRHPVLSFDEGGYRVICRTCGVKWINAAWSSSAVKQAKDLSEFRDGDRIKPGTNKPKPRGGNHA